MKHRLIFKRTIAALSAFLICAGAIPYDGFISPQTNVFRVVADASPTGDAIFANYSTQKEFHLNSIDDLTAFANAVNSGKDFSGKTVVLNADITEEFTTVIGRGEPKFSGTFDGQGHTIKLNINDSVSGYSNGLFGKLYHATVKNVNVTGNIITNNNTGGICGYCNYSTIENCSSNVSITGGGGVGGVVGCFEYGTIINCSSNSTITSVTGNAAMVGGIVGAVRKGKVLNCYSNGNITHTNTNSMNYFGGVCGWIQDKDCTVENCYSSGEIKSTGAGMLNTVGGAIGGMLGIASNCYYDSTKCSKAGGFGKALTTENCQGATWGNLNYLLNYNAILHNKNLAANETPWSYWYSENTKYPVFANDQLAPTFEISTKAELDELADMVQSGITFEGMTIKLTADINDEFTTVIGSQSTPFSGTFDGQEHKINLNISSNVNNVGLFGYTKDATIENLTVTGRVAGSEHVGGICGLTFNSILINCRNEASVQGASYIGGICGWETEDSIAVNCSNIGNVSATSFFGGGLCGQVYTRSTLYNSYNLGNVNCTPYYCGGITGDVDYGAVIKNCYNAGKSQGDAIVGRFQNSNNVISDCYYDSSLQSSSSYGTGLETEICQGKAANSLYDFLNKNVTAHNASLAAGDIAWTYWTAEDATYPEFISNQFNTTIEISTKAELDEFADMVNSGYTFEGMTVKLADDFDMGTNALTTPIGTEAKHFKGTFDGNGKTIKLSIDHSDYAGLFGYVESATIRNITVTGYAKCNKTAGGICGLAGSSNIYNCTNIAIVTGGYSAGGICGFANNDLNIYNCTNIAAVTATDSNCGYAGGILGYAYDYTFPKLYNCTNIAIVTSTYGAGGICGYSDSSPSVYNCVNIAAVSGTHDVGGILGGSSSLEPDIKKCYLLDVEGKFNEDNVTEINADQLKGTQKDDEKALTELLNDNVKNYDGELELCNWIQASKHPILASKVPVSIVNTYDDLELIAYQVNEKICDYSGRTITVSNDFDTESGALTIPIGTETKHFKGTFDGNGKTIKLDIYAKNYNAGLFSTAEGATIKNVTVTGSVTSGYYYVGGICGYAYNNSNIYNCTNNATVKCSSGCIGGICGNTYNKSNIYNCTNNATVNGCDCIGGICGYADNNSNIYNSTNTAKVTGDLNVGGICGYAYCFSNIYNSINTSKVTGDQNIGGICGYAYYYSNINNSINTAKVTGDQNVGGILGNAASLITAGCYSVDTNGISDGEGTGATEITAEQLKGEATLGSGLKLTKILNNYVKVYNSNSANPAPYLLYWKNDATLERPVLTEKTSLADAELKLSADSILYTGSDLTPPTVILDDNVIENGTVFTITYQKKNSEGVYENVTKFKDAGNYKVVVTATDNNDKYVDSVTLEYNVLTKGDFTNIVVDHLRNHTINFVDNIAGLIYGNEYNVTSDYKLHFTEGVDVSGDQSQKQYTIKSTGNTFGVKYDISDTAFKVIADPIISGKNAGVSLDIPYSDDNIPVSGDTENYTVKFMDGTNEADLTKAGTYKVCVTAKDTNAKYFGTAEGEITVLAKGDFDDVAIHNIKVGGENLLTGNIFGFEADKEYDITSDAELIFTGFNGSVMADNRNSNKTGYKYTIKPTNEDTAFSISYTPKYQYSTDGAELKYQCTNNKNDTERKTFATLIMADKTDASNEITDKKIIYGTDFDFKLKPNAPEAEEITQGEISLKKYVSGNEKKSCEQLEGAGKYFVHAEEVYDGSTYSLSFDFTIEAKDIADEDVEKSVIDITYDGDTHTPAAVVKYKGNTLAEGTDYTVNVKDKTDAQTYLVTISGIGNYKGSTTLEWDINKADLTDFVFTDTAPYVKTYDAEAVDVSKKDMSADEGFKINNYPENTTFEFTYSVKDAGGNLTPIDGAPVDAGSYVVSVMPVNPNYNCYPIQKDIVIKKAEVNLIPESKEVTYGTAKNADLGIKYTVADETIIPDADKSLFSDNAVSAFLAAENYDAKSGVAGNYDIVLDTEEFEKYDSDDADTLADYRNFAVSVEDGKLITVNPLNINDDAIEIKFNDNGKNGKYQYTEDYHSLYNMISVIYNGNVWGSDVLKENTDFVLRGNVEKYAMGDYIVQVDAISINSPTLTGRKEVEWSIGMNEVKNFAEDITYGETLVCDIMPHLIDKDATIAYNYYNADTDEKLAAAPTDAGEYYVIADVTNKSGETATFKDTFKISKKSVYAEILDYEITYKDALPNIADIVKFYSDDEGTESVTLTAAETAEIIDFSDEFKQTVFNKGTYDYGFKPGSGNKNYEWNLKYITSSDGTFKVNPKKITEDMFVFTNKAFVLDPNTGYAEIKYDLNGITEDDFSVRGDVSAYEPGSYTVAFYGEDNYTGNVKINWNVASECSYSHSISMNNSMTLNYYVADSDIKGFENVRLEVLNTATGVKEELKGERKIWDKNYGYEYRFSYTGIAAKEIGADIEAVLIAEKNGLEYRFNKDTYSIKEYCYTQLDKPSNDPKLKTMLVDLLNYCSEAQKYFKYDTENLVNAELTDEQKAFGTAEAPNVESCEETIKLDGATAAVSGKTLVFGNSVELKFYMNLQNVKNTDNVKLHISYTDSHNNPVTKDLDFDTFKFSHDEKYGDEYTAKYSGLNAADFGVPVSVTIMDGDKAISDTLVYSIESYAEKFIGKNDISDVLVEMMKYSKSADAYLNK